MQYLWKCNVSVSWKMHAVQKHVLVILSLRYEQRFKIADCSGSVANTETAADVFYFRMFIYSSPDRHMFSGREPSALRFFTSKTNSLVLTYLHRSATFRIQTFKVLFQPTRKITNNLLAVNLCNRKLYAIVFRNRMNINITIRFTLFIHSILQSGALFFAISPIICNMYKYLWFIVFKNHLNYNMSGSQVIQVLRHYKVYIKHILIM